MNFDFNLILLPLTLFFVVVWGLDKFLLRQRKNLGKGNENFLIGWAYDYSFILTLVLILRSFLVEPVNIPSDSMVPTLETGDFVLVNKYKYGVRLPLSNYKLFDWSEPERGDVFIFHYPGDPKITYIKRMVGLPGDHIVYVNGQMTINGQKVISRKVSMNRDQDILDTPESLYSSEILGKRTHLVRNLAGQNPLIAQFNYAKSKKDLPFVTTANDRFIKSNGQSWEVNVPEGHYFALGDNRDQSSDSRFWGFIPEQYLKGQAIYIVAHKKPGLNFPTFRRNRIIQ